MWNPCWASYCLQGSSRPPPGFRLQPTWDSAVLRRVCEVAADAEAILGAEVAGHLRARFADLVAVDSPLELLAGRPQLLEGDPPTVQIHLCRDSYLRLVSNHRVRPTGSEGDTDWSRVRRFRVVSITGVTDEN